ncbi:hypothetical protein P8C59_002984 [Phyllachora maydis]|uniref:Uncharacterized protein n=1 Tax=Phyllachora maydis TaxID=1825666 RepID=A0AAD9MBZ4_9PEZI|nr:hypothetical protein P8C59_002984 [Phyllachora maydis]
MSAKPATPPAMPRPTRAPTGSVVSSPGFGCAWSPSSVAAAGEAGSPKASTAWPPVPLAVVGRDASGLGSVTMAVTMMRTMGANRFMAVMEADASGTACAVGSATVVPSHVAVDTVADVSSIVHVCPPILRTMIVRR